MTIMAITKDNDDVYEQRSHHSSSSYFSSSSEDEEEDTPHSRSENVNSRDEEDYRHLRSEEVKLKNTEGAPRSLREEVKSNNKEVTPRSRSVEVKSRNKKETPRSSRREDAKSRKKEEPARSSRRKDIKSSNKEVTRRSRSEEVKSRNKGVVSRKKDDAAARQRILDNWKQYKLLEVELSSLLSKQARRKDDAQLDTTFAEELLQNHLHTVNGNSSEPLLGTDIFQFETVDLEVDSIMHCDAQATLIEPYQVLGSQEVLRLALPVDVQACDDKDGCLIDCIKDWDLQDPAVCENLSEGYRMTKWVAERRENGSENGSQASSLLHSQMQYFSDSQSDQEKDEWVLFTNEEKEDDVSLSPSEQEKEENEERASSSSEEKYEDFSHSQREQEKAEDVDERGSSSNEKNEDERISRSQRARMRHMECEKAEDVDEWGSSSNEKNEDERISRSQRARMRHMECENESISQASSLWHSQADDSSHSKSQHTGKDEEESASSIDEEEDETSFPSQSMRKEPWNVQGILGWGSSSDSSDPVCWEPSSESSDPDHYLDIPVLPTLTHDDEEMDKDTDYCDSDSDPSSAGGTYTSGASEVTSNSAASEEGGEERLSVNNVKKNPTPSVRFVPWTVFHESEAMSNDPLDEHYDEERATVKKEANNSREACRKWAPWACLIVVVLLAATIGIVVALTSGGRDDGNSQPTTATRIPGNYCFEDSYDLTYSEPVVNSFVDMVRSTLFECADPTTTITRTFGQQWPNCEMLGPTCCQEDYYSECVQNGGRPTAFGSQEMVICNHKSDGGGMVGVGLSDSILCAANSCFGDGSDFQVVSNAAMEMTIDTLRSAGGFLDCRIADQATIDLLDACESKFQPDGAICDVSEDGSCSFYKVLSAEEGGDRDTSSTCEEYCQQQGGTCLFAGGFGNKCQGRIEDRKSCSEPVIGDFCTCANI